jgi:RsiW-degrading membrane proteinase PrsW (M82 family)
MGKTMQEPLHSSESPTHERHTSHAALHPPASYALAGSPLHNPWAAVLILVALGVLILFALLQIVSIFTFAPAGVLRVFFSALGLAIVAGLPALALIWYLDRRERESLWVFFGALLWGMLVATGLALFLNGEGALLIFNFFTQSGLASEAPSQDAERALVQYLTAVLVGPPVEEIVKGLALLLLIWLLRGEFNNMRDGIIYGALVGLGFNMMETAFYVTNFSAQSGSPPYATQLLARFVFFGVNGHLLFTALTGAGLGLARQLSRPAAKVLVAAGGLALAILAHMTHNALAGFIIYGVLNLQGQNPDSPALFNWWLAVAVANVVLQFIPYALLISAIVVSGQWERRVIRQQLAGEVDGQIVTRAEYTQIERESAYGLRRPEGYSRREARALVRAQNKLAFRKWDVRAAGADPQTDSVAQALRAEILGIRGMEPAAGGGVPAA